MRLWIDCEWDTGTNQLISMALVPELGKAFYEELQIDATEIEIWVKENVLTRLDGKQVNYLTFQKRLSKFLNRYEKITVIADWHKDLAWFFLAVGTEPGKCIQLPKVRAELRSFPWAQSIKPHHALADAEANMRAQLMYENTRTIGHE